MPSRMDTKQIDTDQLVEWIELERPCCPFFGFEVPLDRKNKPIWLHLTGPEGVWVEVGVRCHETVEYRLTEYAALSCGVATPIGGELKNGILRTLNTASPS